MAVTKFHPEDTLLAQLVMTTVAIEFGLHTAEVFSPNKGTAQRSHARQVAMYICNTTFEINLTRIARTFGRDRSTVSHAIKAVEDLRDDVRYDSRIQRLEEFLQSAPQKRVG